MLRLYQRAQAHTCPARAPALETNQKIDIKARGLKSRLRRRCALSCATD
jgi:hypothetical protein